jgi:hypothetical protein
VLFIENVGQFADEARFQVWGGTGTMWLAEDGLWITVLEAQEKTHQDTHLTPDREPINENRKGVNLKLSFVDASPHATIEPFQRLESAVNYYRGNDSDKWREGVPVWGGVRLFSWHPQGIHLRFA